jgi:hypothetical protein
MNEWRKNRMDSVQTMLILVYPKHYGKQIISNGMNEWRRQIMNEYVLQNCSTQTNIMIRRIRTSHNIHGTHVIFKAKFLGISLVFLMCGRHHRIVRFVSNVWASLQYTPLLDSFRKCIDNLIFADMNKNFLTHYKCIGLTLSLQLHS